MKEIKPYEDELTNQECIRMLKNILATHPEFYSNAEINEVYKKACDALGSWDEYPEKLWKEAYARGLGERPSGEWIMNKTSARGRNYTCTACKNKSRNAFHFCPNCGARMEAENDT